MPARHFEQQHPPKSSNPTITNNLRSADTETEVRLRVKLLTWRRGWGRISRRSRRLQPVPLHVFLLSPSPVLLQEPVYPTAMCAPGFARHGSELRHPLSTSMLGGSDSLQVPVCLTGTFAPGLIGSAQKHAHQTSLTRTSCSGPLQLTLCSGSELARTVLPRAQFSNLVQTLSPTTGWAITCSQDISRYRTPLPFPLCNTG